MSPLPFTPVSHGRRTLLGLIIGAIACGCTGEACDIIGEPDGLYIHCNGEGDLYYINNWGQQIDKVTLCLGEPFFEESGTGEEIGLADWDNDTEDIDYLRTLCAAKCREVTKDPDNSECSPYAGNIWQVENHKEVSTPDVLMKINDPWLLWGSDMGFADYLATTSMGSSARYHDPEPGGYSQFRYARCRRTHRVLGARLR